MVSITIPTYNSGKTLGFCLEAVVRQSYRDFEVILIDGGSTDDTAAMAKATLARAGLIDRYQFITASDSGLLNARYQGVQQSSGDCVLLLDSDQVLAEDALERAMETMEQPGNNYDMLMLGESSYQTNTLTEKLFDLDRQLLHASQSLDPTTGAVLPRVFRTDLLRNALGQIPVEVRQSVGGEDHAIIYYEACQLSQRVGLVDKAVKHIEPKTMREVATKVFNWGYSSRQARLLKYRDFVLARPINRVQLILSTMFRKRLWKAGLTSLLLFVARGLIYQLGYMKAAIEQAPPTQALSSAVAAPLFGEPHDGSIDVVGADHDAADVDADSHPKRVRSATRSALKAFWQRGYKT